MPERQISKTVLLDLQDLTLSRKEGQAIEFTVAGETFYVLINQIERGRVRLTIRAKASVKAWRVSFGDNLPKELSL